jgi:hypothetical protein
MRMQTMEVRAIKPSVHVEAKGASNFATGDSLYCLYYD